MGFYSVKRTDNNRSYRFKLVQIFNDKLEQLSTSIPVPGSPPESSLVFTLQAQTGFLTLSWLIYNDGTDTALGSAPQDGTFTDTDGDSVEDVVTIFEQKKWLKEFIFNGDLGVQFLLFGDDLPSAGLKVSIRDLQIDKRVEDPLLYDGQISFTVGTV